METQINGFVFERYMAITLLSKMFYFNEIFYRKTQFEFSIMFQIEYSVLL